MVRYVADIVIFNLRDIIDEKGDAISYDVNAILKCVFQKYKEVFE